MSNKATHLGDGAYVSVDQSGDLVITANDHDPDLATDAVYIDRAAALAMTKFTRLWAKTQRKGHETPHTRRAHPR